MKTKPLRKLRTILLSAFLIITAVFCVAESGRVFACASAAAESCFTVILPSLYGFMLLSAIIVKSGAYKIIFRPLNALGRFFGMDEELLSIFFLSLVGGYPTGALLLSESGAEEGRRAAILPFCYCGSPVFYTTVIGGVALGNRTIGVIMYLCGVIPLIVGASISFAYSRTKALQKRTSLPRKRSDIDTPAINSTISFSTADFTACIASTGRSMLMIISVIMAFSLASAIAEFLLELVGAPKTLFSFVSCLIDISAVTRSTGVLPALLAFLMSIGGVSGIVQVAAAAGKLLKPVRFFAIRLLCAAFSALLTLCLCHILSPVIAVSAASSGIVSVSPLASLALIMMTATLLYGNGTAGYRKE